MTIYEKAKTMTKAEFSEFCLTLYNKGWIDGSNDFDGEHWVRLCLADFDYAEFNGILTN